MAFAYLFLISLILLPISPLLAFNPSLFPCPLFFVTLFTVLLSHANIFHLLGNYIFAAPYALYVEHKVGSKNFLRLFFYGGIAASLWQTIFFLSIGPSILIGSSGGMSALAGAACMLVDGKPIVRVVGKVVFACLLGIQLYSVLFGLLDHTAYMAHIGGLVTGALLSYHLPHPPTPDHSKKNS